MATESRGRPRDKQAVMIKIDPALWYKFKVTAKRDGWTIQGAIDHVLSHWLATKRSLKG